MTLWQDFPDDRLLVDLSIWSANLTVLGDEIRRMDPWVDLFHFDVSDAHFVPGLLFFPDLVAALRPLTRRPFHVHLMVERPDQLVQPFLEAGADRISVHVENGRVGVAAIEQIRQSGKSAGIAVALETSLEETLPYLDRIDSILLMGTRLGMKGQGLAPEAAGRIRSMRSLLDAQGYTGRIKIFADGGIRQTTVPTIRSAGADGIVPGSLIFGSVDPEGTFRWIHSLPGKPVRGAHPMAQ